MTNKELTEQCLEYIKRAPYAEDAGDYTMGAIELAGQLRAEEPDPKEDSPSPQELSRAVVASSGAGDWGVVLWYEGPDLEREIEEVGQGMKTDSLGLFRAPEGISVWEGKYLNNDGTLEADGTFRDLTPQEWAKIQGGENPWV
jgi:hypothetical protein